MLYPLRFQPIFRRYLWGGRRLATVMNKPIEMGDDWAESWEVVDHGEDQSVVAAGALAGKTLHEIVASHNAELFGRHAPQNEFPLLFKLLDCQKHLSVQAHPNDEQAAQLDPPDLGKTEAWYIVDAEPGSVVWAGLKRGFDRRALAREVERGTVELCLAKLQPQPGDCLFIPAGVVHALGAGLLVAEIQQASDTTYRLHDWNRVGPDGQPRALHIDEALDVIDYNFGPVTPQTPRTIFSGEQREVERLVECDKFVLDRVRVKQPGKMELGGGERFHIVSVLTGRLEVSGDALSQPLERGQTTLLAAALNEVAATATEPTCFLDMYLP